MKLTTRAAVGLGFAAALGAVALLATYWPSYPNTPSTTLPPVAGTSKLRAYSPDSDAIATDGGVLVAGDVAAGGSLWLDGGAVVHEDLNVGGDAAVAGSLGVDGGASVHGDMAVGGACGVDGGLLVAGGVRADTAIFSGSLGVDGGAVVWGGFGLGGSATVQGDVAVAGDIRAVDGGPVDFAGEVHVWGSNRVCFADAGSCVYDNNNILTVTGKDAVSVSSPLNAVGIFRAGQQMNNYVEHNGSVAGSPVTVSAFGSSQDIGVRVVPKGDGGLWVEGAGLRSAVVDAGSVWTNNIGNPDAGYVNFRGYGYKGETQATLPACNAASSGSTSYLYVGSYADGGAENMQVFCDGTQWRSSIPALPFALTSFRGVTVSGSQVLEANQGLSGGEIWYCTASIVEAGSGAGAFQIVIRQGGVDLCSSPSISCTATQGTADPPVWDGDPRPGTGNGPCPANWFTPRLAGSDAGSYNVYAVVTGTCSQFPTFSGACLVRRLGLGLF